MSEVPSKEGFIDPNARLLASVIPPPPPTFWRRVGQALQSWRIDPQGIVEWSRSREGRSCFLVALAAASIALVLYRSEPSSFAGTLGAISRETRSSPAILAKRESVRPAPPRALAVASAPPRQAPVARAEFVSAVEPERAMVNDVPRADERRAPELRRGSARAERHASAGKKARKKFEKRKARRKAIARASSRARRSKNKPAKESNPLRAWIASQSRDESSTTKRR